MYVYRGKPDVKGAKVAQTVALDHGLEKNRDGPKNIVLLQSLLALVGIRNGEKGEKGETQKQTLRCAA